MTQATLRVLFFARAQVTIEAAQAIEPSHILIGVFRTVPSLPEAAGSNWTTQQLLDRLASPGGGKPVERSVSVPMSTPTADLLMHAFQTAEAMGSEKIQPAHIVIAIFDEQNDRLATLLRDAGVDRQKLVATLEP